MKKCQDWLLKSHPTMHARIWSTGSSYLTYAFSTFPKHVQLTPYFFCQYPEALAAATSSLSLEAQEKAAKDAQKKAAKAQAAEQKQADKLASSIVTIRRVERNKKKHVTSVAGLEAFGLDLKKVKMSAFEESCH